MWLGCFVWLYGLGASALGIVLRVCGCDSEVGELERVSVLTVVTLSAL